MPAESPVALLVPDGGVVVAGRVCARLSALVRASLVDRQRGGLPPSAELVTVLRVVDQAAANYQRRQQPVSAGTSVLVPVISASPRSAWVNVSHAALALGVTERQVRNLCDTGTLHAEKDQRHQWRIDPQSIENERARRGYGEVEHHQGTDS